MVNQKQGQISSTLSLVIAAMCIALGLVLPFLTGQIHAIGNMLCPMHIPVLIAGFLLGPKYSGAVGFLTPLLRSAIFGMPIMYPGAISMAFELATAAIIAGLMHQVLRIAFYGKIQGKKKHYAVLYVSLICAMLASRVMYGIVRFAMLGIAGTDFNLAMWFTIVFAKEWPGIVLQLIIIPPLVRGLQIRCMKNC